jgi:hypothetical protein
MRLSCPARRATKQSVGHGGYVEPVSQEVQMSLECVACAGTAWVLISILALAVIYGDAKE